MAIAIEASKRWGGLLKSYTCIHNFLGFLRLPLDTYEQADKLLDVLGKAPIAAPGALFQNDLAKKWMESCIIRAVKKLQAAEYHYTNINSEIRELHRSASKAARIFKGTQGKMFTRGDKDSIAFELDAFLAAARSCIDFVSGMLALHVGMHRRTGSTRLLEKVRRDSAAPFSGLLTNWQEWIEQVKKYRDECVHYQTIYMSGGFEIESRGGKKVATIIPVLVPKEILPDKPTTRTGRNVMMLVDMHKNIGIEGVPPHAKGPLSDAAKKVMEILAEFKPERYVPVEDFCGQHLEKLHQFVSESFREVLALKFLSPVA
jgi:hypothetical protein